MHSHMPYPVSFQKRFKTMLKIGGMFCCLYFCAMTSKENNPDRQMIRWEGPWMETQKTWILIPGLPQMNMWPWTSPLNLSGHQFPALSTALWFSSLTHRSFPVLGIRLYKLRAGVAIHEFNENGHVISCLPFYTSRWWWWGEHKLNWVLGYWAFIK